jgi:hypothetical protein
MDVKQVAGAWIVAVVIVTACLGALSHLIGSDLTLNTGLETTYTAPVRSALPRSWHEATGSLPAKTVVLSDVDDEEIEIEPPDHSDMDLAFDSTIR